MNPEDNNQPSTAPEQTEPNQSLPEQPTPEGPLVQDVVTSDAQSQQPPAVKQPPLETQDQSESEGSDNQEDTEHSAEDSPQQKSSVSLGGEFIPPEEDEAELTQTEAPTKPQKQPKVKQPSQHPIGFIIATVIVALVLMGLVIMMYMNQEAEAPTVPSNTAPTSQPAGETEVFNDESESEQNTMTDPADIIDEVPAGEDGSSELDETDEESADEEGTTDE